MLTCICIHTYIYLYTYMENEHVYKVAVYNITLGNALSWYVSV